MCTAHPACRLENTRSTRVIQSRELVRPAAVRRVESPVRFEDRGAPNLPGLCLLPCRAPCRLAPQRTFPRVCAPFGSRRCFTCVRPLQRQAPPDALTLRGARPRKRPRSRGPSGGQGLDAERLRRPGGGPHQELRSAARTAHRAAPSKPQSAEKQSLLRRLTLRVLQPSDWAKSRGGVSRRRRNSKHGERRGGKVWVDAEGKGKGLLRRSTTDAKAPCCVRNDSNGGWIQEKCTLFRRRKSL